MHTTKFQLFWYEASSWGQECEEVEVRAKVSYHEGSKTGLSREENLKRVLFSCLKTCGRLEHHDWSASLLQAREVFLYNTSGGRCAKEIKRRLNLIPDILSNTKIRGNGERSQLHY